MKKISLLILVVLIITLTSCENAPSQISTVAKINSDSINSIENTAENLTSKQCNGIPLNDGYNTVFDFAELSADTFVNGEFTINQLIQKYGTPSNIYGWISSFETTVGMTIDFSGMSIDITNYDETSNLSFNTDSNKQALDKFDDSYKEFPITLEDKTIPMKIDSFYITDPKLHLPRELKIGTSTNSQVLSAYPEDSQWNDFENFYIEYAYIFFEPGMMEFDEDENDKKGIIIYIFDTQDILTAVFIDYICNLMPIST